MKTLATILFALLLTTSAFADSATNRSNDLVQRLELVTIPSIDFRSADILTVVDFLISQTMPSPTNVSVQLSYINDIKQQLSERKPHDPDPRQQAVSEIPPLTLTLGRTNLLAAVAAITKAAGLTYEIKDEALVIKTMDGTILNR